ncbi:MAG: DoxX family protein [Tannerellaceae bacterium]|jgi:uncharacterized membrane protein YphA (DoxX/SURF4 family)|nr:DoxX family protein [Tannerellaceae bacterium]
MKKNVFTKSLPETCRILTGATFTFSGFVKAIDPMGFTFKIGEYLSSFGLEKISGASEIFAFALISVEFALGICMILGVYRKTSSMLILALMGIMTPLTLYLAIANPVSDCGCFGDALVISNWATFIKNIILLAASLFLFINHKGIKSLYPVETQWFIPLFALTYCLGFSWWNYTNLPLIDFRPYKIGIHIPSQMQIPEGAPQDEYLYTLTYEKNGKKEKFTLENYPANDTTWKFISTETKLIKKGYTPPIPSFSISDEKGNEISEKLLGNTDNVLLLISPKLEYANDKHINEITNLHEYASNHKILFYCITGSSKESISEWKDLTGAEYPFLTADETQLKTIVRSNPGLVWLNNGQIMMKRHHNNFPDEETANKMLTTKQVQHKGNGWIIFTLLTFSLPLLTVWIYSFICFTWKNKSKNLRKTNS